MIIFNNAGTLGQGGAGGGVRYDQVQLLLHVGGLAAATGEP